MTTSTTQYNKSEFKKLYHDLYDKVGVFWAFSEEQFDAGLAKLGVKKENALQEISSMGDGGYILKKNVPFFLEERERISKLEKERLKADKVNREQIILQELRNYECFYTGDIEDCVRHFKGTIIKRKDVKRVYIKYASKYE